MKLKLVKAISIDRRAWEEQGLINVIASTRIRGSDLKHLGSHCEIVEQGLRGCSDYNVVVRHTCDAEDETCPCYFLPRYALGRVQ